MSVEVVELEQGVNMRDISKYLSDGLNITFNNETESRMNSRCTYVQYPAKTTLLLEGERAKSLFYIIRGIVRGYYIDKQGNDITKCFSGEKQFFSSEGLRTGCASSFCIESLEECQCVKIPYALIDELLERDQAVGDALHLLYLKEIKKLERQGRNLLVMSAKERYLDFCSEYPKLASQVDLQYIASYIGIRPASLSRIRKQIVT